MFVFYVGECVINACVQLGPKAEWVVMCNLSQK